MLLTILLFILLLGLLVLAHEWGHFIVARKLGIRVEEFAFGFPPRLAGITRRGTRYVLNLFPIGGYVKIFGESGESEQNPESFSSRPLWQRLAIIAAGVGMNLVLAWLLFSLGHGLGLPTVLGEGERARDERIAIIGVVPASPAARADIQFGDAISAIRIRNSEFRIQAIDEVQRAVGEHRGEEIVLVLRRGSQTIERALVPRRDAPEGEGPLGIALARLGVIRSPWWRALWDGAKTTASATAAITSALGRIGRDLFAEGRVPAEVSGPVGIFVFANETRQLGIVYLIELAGILSVNLALLNILPIPALDGGRILFLFIEGVRGVRMNERVEQAIHTVGFALLLALMAAITYRDVVRIF